MRILIIEDEKDMAATLRDLLKKNYTVDVAYSGKSGIHQAKVNDYDLITIDVALPDISGLIVCETIRKEKILCPIIMVTAHHDPQEKVRAFDVCADDYLTKPFNFEELRARIRALLRRPRQLVTEEVLRIDSLELDPERRVVNREGQSVNLRRKEFDLLEYLMRNKGRVLTRSMILDHVWDNNVDPFTNAIDVHIKHLRDKIDRPFSKKLIQTVHGLGYKIES